MSVFITYHKEVEKPSDVKSLVPFGILDKHIKSYLEERDLYQEDYYIDYNAWYCFIYLENGDRIDVEL